MALKRASGTGSTNRRFAKVLVEGEVIKIPVVKDTGTIIYLTDDGEWPDTPIAVIPADIDWMTEGKEFVLESRTPGSMGKRVMARVVETQHSIQIERKSGKYAHLGQAKRNVLVQEINDKFTKGTPQ